MDQETRRLLDELRGAINQALLSSNRFAQIVDLCERSGRGIAISMDIIVEGADDQDWVHERDVRKYVLAELSWSIDDRKFLRVMKIDAGAEG
jgi:hypothetical protein